ncbi:hypothetical protein [Bacillus sp. 71mf]|uniref:hypothetical protein n=1 Tax=Bacillus sp. 71mf TaxID=1761757 RepID=UPI001113C18E|nr:hypothetical protein [Bacillus sp. 71mf]
MAETGSDRYYARPDAHAHLKKGFFTPIFQIDSHIQIHFVFYISVAAMQKKHARYSFAPFVLKLRRWQKQALTATMQGQTLTPT